MAPPPFPQKQAAGDPGGLSSRRASSRSTFETALIVGGFAVLFFALPHAVIGDGVIRFGDIEGLLNDGTLSRSNFSLTMPLASAPLLLFGRIVESPAWWAARSNVVFVAIGTLVTWRLVRGCFPPSLFRKATLILLFASLLTNQLRGYDAEVFTATLVTVGLAALATGRPVGGWTAIVIGAVNTPAALLPLGLLAVAETIREHRFRWLLAPAAAALLVMTEDWARRGGPLTTGYEGNHGLTTLLPYSGRPGFSLPFVVGLVSILFSFGRGLAFYVPGLLLWASGSTRRLLGGYRWTVTLMLLFVAGLALVYAKWWAWYGGIAWGPRFFAFAAVPASILIAVRLESCGRSVRSDVATLAVLLLSGWVALAGATADLAMLQSCKLESYGLESFCWYTPELSSLWWPILHFPALGWATALTGGYVLAVLLYLAHPLVASLGSAAARVRIAVAPSGSWRF